MIIGRLFSVVVVLGLMVSAFTPAVFAKAVGQMEGDGETILEIASSDERFSTLTAAIQAAGLEETLSGEGPFTVFAPTNDAFAKLPAGTVEALLADVPTLTEILLYHVVPGKFTAEEVIESTRLETASGQSIMVRVEEGNVFINDAQVIITDIEASNGVIHVIDTVLQPRDVVATLAADGRFTTLVAAVEAAGLVETLQGEGPFTIFAPTDEAFEKLPEGALDGLLNDPAALQQVLLYHVVPGEYFAEDIVKLDSVETASGASVNVRVREDCVKLNRSQVTQTDMKVSNGVIHVIDKVLLPPTE